MPSAHANRHAPEFKQRAAQLYESRSPVTYAEVARELGVDLPFTGLSSQAGKRKTPAPLLMRASSQAVTK
jgi:transposase-like protein